MQIIFDRSFAAKVPDVGDKTAGRVDDVVSYFDEHGAWQTREVASVCGLLLTTRPFIDRHTGKPVERDYSIPPKAIIKIERR